jgi:hypothetical protein
MNRKLLIAGVACLVVFLVPASFTYGRSADHGWFLLPLVPVGLIGISLIAFAAIRELFLGFGYGSMLATFSAGLIAVGQYFIGAASNVQGMMAFWSAVFAWCGGALVVLSGVMWLLSTRAPQDPQ